MEQVSYRQGSIYVGQILKGAKPAELPVMQPTKFDLIIDLRTAKVLKAGRPQEAESSRSEYRNYCLVEGYSFLSGDEQSKRFLTRAPDNHRFNRIQI